MKPFHVLAAFAALAFLSACGGGEPGDPESAAAVPAGVGVPPVESAGPNWTLDLDRMRVPDRPAAGNLGGRSFVPDRFEISSGILKLACGEGFIPDQSITIFLFLERGERLDGKTYRVGRGQKGMRPHIHVDWKDEAGTSQSKVFMKDYALVLVFGPREKRSQPGEIFLSLPEEKHGWLAGRFDATVARDRSEPPGDDEVPFVQGTVRAEDLTGADGARVNLTVGYVGATAAGKTASNLAGTTLVKGGGSGVSSETFKPRVTSLHHEGREVATYQHVVLEPGQYLFYVLREKRLAAWRWATVEPGSRLSVDFEVGPSRCGDLAVRVGAGAQGEVVLDPLDPEGKVPPLSMPFERLGTSFAIKTGKEIEGEVVLFEGLGAGPYRVRWGDAVLERVDVAPGGRVEVELGR